MKLPQLDQDKANHVIYGVVIYMVFHFHSVELGIAAGMVIGVVWEAAAKGVDDMKDALATLAGALLGAACSI